MSYRTHRLRRTLSALVAATVLSLSSAAWSQPVPPIPTSNGEGFDLRLFRPAVDSKGLFSVNGTDILGAGAFSFGFVGDLGFNLLRAGAMREPFVDVAFNGVLQGNVGIANLLVLGLQVPISVLSGSGRATQDAMQDPRWTGIPRMGMGAFNPPQSGFSYQGLSDITLHAKLRWLRAEYHPVGLALLLQGGFNPMFGSRSLASEPLANVWPSVALELRPHRRVRIDFNLGARIPFGGGSTIGAPGNQATYGPSLTWGAGVSWRAAPVLDLVAETYGQLYLTGFSQVPASMPWEVSAGLKLFIERNSYLLLGGGTRVVPGGFGSADGRAFVGILFEPSIGDADGDGYRDDVDQCINDPEDFDNFQDDDGCSDPDNDRDGILDVNDQCPIIPEDRDGDQDNDGCPEGQESDRDGDGNPDNRDRCPDEPEDRDNFEDDEGCPDPDNDRDSIEDPVDNCPNEPEDFDNFQDEDGCPDPDNDGDGILDANDHDRSGQVDCRNDPEIFNGVDDDDGCPDSGDLQILGNVINLREQIQFETDSAEIRPVSFPILEQMANLLRRNAQFELVEVEGHTDVRADDAHNLQLSLDRANAVMRGLVQRGIDASRLVAAGYGEYCPLDRANNPRAWERNRRVQFIIVRTRDEGRTTAAAGCRRGAQYIPATVGPPGTGVARERSTPGQTPGNTPPAGGASTPPAAGNSNPPAASAPAATPPATPAQGSR